MNPYKIDIKDTFDLIDNKKYYRPERCIAYIKERGLHIFGSHFMISPKQKRIFDKLITYAVEDYALMNKLQLFPNKGLLLMGEKSSGKTAYIRLVQSFFSRRRSYTIKSSRLLAQEFSCKGYEVFTPLLESNARVLCLDNIGQEHLAKYYGSTCDVVYYLVEHFYEHRFDLPYPKLHITTSLSPPELEKKYGKGFRTMLQELCNVIICE